MFVIWANCIIVVCFERDTIAALAPLNCHSRNARTKQTTYALLCWTRCDGSQRRLSLHTENKNMNVDTFSRLMCTGRFCRRERRAMLGAACFCKHGCCVAVGHGWWWRVIICSQTLILFSTLCCNFKSMHCSSPPATTRYTCYNRVCRWCRSSRFWSPDAPCALFNYSVTHFTALLWHHS